MKLLNIKIYGFGKFVNFSYDFNEKLTIMDEPNSFGKTTIAQFIKTMFYGLPTASKDIENPRVKYKPWDSEKFGGELTFEVEEKKYIIYREFGISLTNDTFRLYDCERRIELEKFLDKKILNKGKNFGEILFGVNEISFEKINFIQQLEVKYFDSSKALHSDINTRLREVFSDTSDDNNYKKAETVLKNAVNDISPKSRRQNAKYVKNEEKINELNTFINEALKAKENISNFENTLSLRKKQKETNDKKTKEIDKKLDLISKKEKRQLELENYTKLKDSKENLLKEFNLTKSFFKELDIKKIELDKLKELKEKYKKEENNLNDYKEAKQKEINKITAEIADKKSSDTLRIVIEREIEDIKSKISEIEVSKERLNKKIKSFKFIDLILSIITLFIYFFIFKSKNNYLKKEILKLEEKKEELNNNLEKKNKELSSKQNTGEIVTLEKKLDEIKKDKEVKENEFAKFMGDIFDVYNRFQIDTDNIDLAYHKVETSYRRYFELEQDINKNEKELSKYNIAEIESELKTYESLKEDILQKEKEEASKVNDRLIKEINTIEGQINENTELANNLELYEVELEDLKVKRQEYDKQRTLIEKTLELLEIANQKLSTKYLNPLEEKINDLIEKFNLKEIKIRFDGNSVMEVRPTKDHSYKEFGYFSTGYQDLISVLLRIALIDIIYKDINPVIVFDDSFVNFDDERVKLVKPMLDKLSKKYQIIYFTCSSSRNLKD